MPRAHSGQVVLVVDDDRDLRRLVKRLLEPLGYVVLEAATAADALSLAGREPPTVVVLDVLLPDMPGYEVCRELRDAYADDIAIVFLSGKRTEEFDRTAGMLLGADDYIVKPFMPGEFVARVRRAGDRASALPLSSSSALTPRELEVLKLLAEGLARRRSRRRSSSRRRRSRPTSSGSSPSLTYTAAPRLSHTRTGTGCSAPVSDVRPCPAGQREACRRMLRRDPERCEPRSVLPGPLPSPS